MVYIYFLVKENVPYYVGMSKKPNTRYSKNGKGKQAHLEVIEEHDSMDSAIAAEIFWMEQLRQWGFEICNKKDFKYNKIYRKKKNRINKVFIRVGDKVFDTDWVEYSVTINNYWKYIQFEGRQYGLSKMIDATGYCEQVRLFGEETKTLKLYIPKSKYKEIYNRIKDILSEYEVIPKDVILSNRRIDLDTIKRKEVEDGRHLRGRDKDRKAHLLGLLKHIRKKTA